MLDVSAIRKEIVNCTPRVGEEVDDERWEVMGRDNGDGTFGIPQHEIITGLFLGNGAARANVVRYQNPLAFDRIVTVTLSLQAPLPEGSGIQQLVAPLGDNSSGVEQMRHTVQESFSFIDDGLEKGEKVLVHCDQGSSRSATVVVAYLMRKCATNFQDTHTFVKNKRLTVDVREHFVPLLKELEDSFANAS
jgi:hypothetical protein